MRIFLILLLTSLLSAGEVTIKLNNGNVYKGIVKRYSDSTLSLEIDPANKTVITVKYNAIDRITHADITLFRPIDKSDIKTIFPPKKSTPAHTPTQKSSANRSFYSSPEKPEAQTAEPRTAFPPCYNDEYLERDITGINNMSDSAFTMLLYNIDGCADEMNEIGIIRNPCHNHVYKRLHTAHLDSLSKREFQVLQKLRKHCFEFQDDVEWSYNLCEDPVYKKLQAKPGGTLSFKEALYIEQLRKDCEELKDDLDDDYDDHWPTRYAMHNDTLLVEYDPPGTAKPFLTAGGILIIPGIALPITGGVLLANNQYSSDPWEVDIAFKRLFGWIFLGVGIACDCAGITLLSFGSIKQNKVDEFNKLKNDYEEYRQRNMKEVSINFNFEF